MNKYIKQTGPSIKITTPVKYHKFTVEWTWGLCALLDELGVDYYSKSVELCDFITINMPYTCDDSLITVKVWELAMKLNQYNQRYQ
jgi:ribosome recycling factor